METKGFFQFEIIINDLVSFFHFIWIPMLWVYDQVKYFYNYSAGIDFRRQNVTSTDVKSSGKVDTRTVRVMWRQKHLPLFSVTSIKTG